MDLELSDKRALVCGGSRGIGKAIALTLLEEGAQVAIAACDPKRLEDSANELRQRFGTKVAYASFDVRDDDSVHEMVDEVAEQLGGIDILVNSAAPPGGGSYRWDQLPAEPFLADLNNKAMGYLRCAQSVAPLMIANGWGRIINIGGLNVHHGDTITSIVRNTAVVAMAKNIADELGAHGVNVTTVHPWYTETERPIRGHGSEVIIGRVVQAREVAQVVAFLASPKSVAIAGEAIGVGGGIKGSIYC